jgi:hypothetical protein
LDLSEFLGNFPQILQGDVASLADIVGHEYFFDLIPRLVLGGPSRHHVEKLIELNLATAILIDFGNHVPHSLGFGLNAQGVDGLLQL